MWMEVTTASKLQVDLQALLVFLHIFLIAFAGLWMALIKGNLW